MPNTQEQVFICRCEEVTREEIQAAIDEGAATVTGIKKRTGAGMGLCQGRTCRRLIAGMLAEKCQPADILPQTSRPPARTARISEFIDAEDD